MMWRWFKTDVEGGEDRVTIRKASPTVPGVQIYKHG